MNLLLWRNLHCVHSRSDSNKTLPGRCSLKLTRPTSLSLSLYRPPLQVHEKPAPGTELPPPKEFALRRSLVSFRADSSNTVVVSFANHAFLDFVHNWVSHLTRVGVDNLLVGE